MFNNRVKSVVYISDIVHDLLYWPSYFYLILQIASWLLKCMQSIRWLIFVNIFYKCFLQFQNFSVGCLVFQYTGSLFHAFSALSCFKQPITYDSLMIRADRSLSASVSRLIRCRRRYCCVSVSLFVCVCVCDAALQQQQQQQQLSFRFIHSHSHDSLGWPEHKNVAR